MPDQRTTFTVRGGRTRPGDEHGYDAAVPFFHTLWDIAVKVKAETNDTRSINAIMLEISRDNNLPHPRTRRSCTLRNVVDVRLHPGQELTLRVDHPIEVPVKYACPPGVRRTAQPVEEEPGEEVVVRREERREEEPVVRRPAQLNLTPHGARQYTRSITGFDYYLGEDPRDPAAQGHSRLDRRRGDALMPGYAEGTRTVIDTTGEAARSEAPGAGGRRNRGRFVNSRAGDNAGRFGEFRYRPSQVEFIDTDPASPTYGQPRGWNRRYDYKFEETARFAVDAQGNLIAVADGSALISQDRRLNPQRGNQFTDAMTARNFITNINSTPEGNDAVLSAAGIDRAIGLREQRFFGQGATPTTQDAEQMIQLHVQSALHPFVWSVHNNDVPMNNIAILRGKVNGIFESPQFGTLPEADRERLRTTYAPYLPLVDNPQALNERITANGGRATWFSPMPEWAEARVQIRNIERNYGDQQGVRRSRQTDEQRRTHALAVGNALGHVAWNNTIRVPTQTEYQLGSGELFNTERQQASPMAQNRIAFLRQLEENPERRAQYTDLVVNTPGAMDRIVNTVFDSTRATGVNSTILAHPNDGAADRFGYSVAERFGGRENRKRMNYSGGNVLVNNLVVPVVRLATLGFVNGTDINGGRNQIRGIADGFQEATRDRFNAGGQTRAQVDAAMLDLIRQARIAEENGVPQAGTSLMLAVNRNLNEDMNGGRTSAKYDAFYQAVGERGQQAIDDQMVVNQPGLAARVQLGTNRRVLAGEEFRQVDAQGRLVGGSAAVTADVAARTADAAAANAETNAGGREARNGDGAPAIRENKGAETAAAAAAIAAAGRTTNGDAATRTADAATRTAGTRDAGTAAGRTTNGDAATRTADADAGAADGRTANDTGSRTAVPQAYTGTRFDVSAALDARSRGDAREAARVLSTATNPDRVSQEQINAVLATSSASASPVAFSVLAAETLAGLHGTSENGMSALRAAISSIDRGKGQSSRYADLVKAQADTLRAAAGNPERLAAAREAMGRTFSEFLAGGEHGNERMASVDRLARNIDRNPATAALYAGAFRATTADGERSLLAGVSDEGRLAFLALKANPDINGRLAGFEAWVARYAGENATHNAGRGFSYTEVGKLILLLWRPPVDDPVVRVVEEVVCGTAGRPVCPDRPGRPGGI